MSKLIRITRDIEQPPGSWVYTVPETGLVVRSASAKGLAVKVRAHLEANGKEIPQPWGEWFEDALCKQMNLGHPYCGQEVVRPRGPYVHLNLHLAERFLKTILGLIRKRELVPQEEAERRANICMTSGPDGGKCPNNIVVGGCRGCYFIDSALSRLLKGRNTVAQPDTCRNCGCLLKAKVHVPNDILDEAERTQPVEYPSWCWRVASAQDPTPNPQDSSPS